MKLLHRIAVAAAVVAAGGPGRVNGTPLLRPGPSTQREVSMRTVATTGRCTPEYGCAGGVAVGTEFAALTVVSPA
jgi:hypothetical protein